MKIVWLGVDIAKADLQAEVAVGTGVALGKFDNHAEGFALLCQQVAPFIDAETLVCLVVEPTGGYELALVTFAYQQGWQVSLPNPKQVRDWAKGRGMRAKNDAQDAHMLARYGVECQPPAHIALSREVSELDSLVKRRRDIEQMLQQERNRLQEMAQRPGIAGAVKESLTQVIEALQQALRQIEAEINAHLQQNVHLQEDSERLAQLPGIGPKVVLPLLVTLYHWQTLTAGKGSSKGLTALVGLDPKCFVSGTSVYKHPSISKMGNAEVRRLLYMGALSAVHGHNPLHVFYQRLVGRGKAKKLAVVAAARKLLTWAWVIFCRRSTWNPSLHAT